MAHDAAAPAASGKVLIRNIGLLLSGDIARPILDADAILVVDGRIAGIGRLKDLDAEGARTVIDAHGCAVVPGLIDSHVHPVAGDWTPRQSQMNWIDSTLHGGVTTMISAGEVHTPGRPRDVVGLKAMAIAAQRMFTAFRPGGMKIHAGAPVIEPDMVEQDFKDLAEAGVTLLGEVGLGGVKDGPTARRMVGWARQYGIQSTIHTGGPSIPGSGLIDAAVVLEADTDVVGHVNGGHTALPDREIRCICEGCRRGLEIVHNGNERAALYTMRTAREMGQLERVILGTDGPAGSGVQPLGILRMISMLSSLGEVPAEVAFCFGTGNTARMRSLDCGLIEVGRAADFSFLDRPQHRRRPHAARGGRARRPAWSRHGDDRRDRAHGPQPQHPAGGGRAGGRGELRSRVAQQSLASRAARATRSSPSSGASVSSVIRTACPTSLRTMASPAVVRATRWRRRSVGSGRVSVKPRADSRSITPLIVAASIATLRPSRFWLRGPHSSSFARAAHCMAVTSPSIPAAKMPAWRCTTWRRTKPICSSSR